MNTSNYETEFSDAIKRADSWGLCAPYFKASEKRYLDDSGTKKLQKGVQSIFEKMSPDEVSQQCFAVTLSLQKLLEKLLGTQLSYTLGYVEMVGRNIFYTPENELKKLMGAPPSMRSYNLHAWLTSPSYEIIDLTFGTTFGVVLNKPECIGASVAQHHSELKKGLAYHPQIIGDDFLVEIGALLRV
jgi:hypothetical protein